MSQLQHIAITRPVEVGRYPGAQIIRVTEATQKPRPLQGRLTGAQGHAELYRRVVEDGLDWADAYDELVDRVDAPGNWWLPPTQAYLNRANRGRRLAA
jgi:hypothetical protein